MNAPETWRRLGGWAALAVLLLWLVAFGTALVIQATIFPGYADRFVPAKIQAHLVATSVDATVQLVMGTALVALAFGLSYYLSTPLTPLTQLALVAGIAAGICMIAAGAVLQENAFSVVFPTAEQTTQLALAAGLPDLTAITVATTRVAGGLRSTAAYASGWAMALWSIAALRTKRLPAVLNGIGLVTAILFALTVWIGPLTGPVAFVGMLIWHAWLGVRLLHTTAAVVTPQAGPLAQVRRGWAWRCGAAGSRAPLPVAQKVEDHDDRAARVPCG